MESMTSIPGMSATATPMDMSMASSIPGMQMLSEILLKMGLDPSLLVRIGFFITIAASAVGFASNAWAGVTQAFRLFSDHVVSSATIQSSDETYVYLMRWFNTHDISTDSRLFGVTSRKNTSHPNYQLMTWYYDRITEENKDADGLEKTEDSLGPKLKYTPAPGYYYFFYKSKFYILQRILKDDYYGFENPDETICLFTIGRSALSLRTLLEEARIEYLEEQKTQTLVYTTVASYPPAWSVGQPRHSRKLNTVVMKSEEKTRLLKDMREYLKPSARDWYNRKGLPYRRGYLFYGAPGTGKTSLSMALAGELNLKLYVLSLGASTLSDDSLQGLFASLPKKCIVLLEDIDAAGVGRESLYAPGGLTLTTAPPIGDDDESDDEEEEKNKKKLNRVQNSAISLSGLLNTIDGVGAHEGRVLIMTTNHRSELDKALIRPGRVDMEINFGLADSEILHQVFRAVFLDDDDLVLEDDTDEKAVAKLETYKLKINKLADIFAEKVPSDRFTPAEVQGFLLGHKADAQDAMDHLDEWLSSKMTDIERFEAKEEKIKERLRKAKEKKAKELAKKRRDEERAERKELEEIEEETKKAAEKLKEEEDKKKKEAEGGEKKEEKKEETKETKEDVATTNGTTTEKVVENGEAAVEAVATKLNGVMTNGVKEVSV